MRGNGQYKKNNSIQVAQVHRTTSGIGNCRCGDIPASLPISKVAAT